MMDERVGGLDARVGEMPVGVATGLPGAMDQAKAYMVRLREAVNKFDDKDLRRVTGWSFKASALGDTLGEATTPTGSRRTMLVWPGTYSPARMARSTSCCTAIVSELVCSKVIVVGASAGVMRLLKHIRMNCQQFTKNN